MPKNNGKNDQHFVKLPVAIINVPESKLFLTSPAGFIYFYLLSWVYHKGAPANNNYNSPRHVLMAKEYRLGRLGLIRSLSQIEKETGYSKSTVESSLGRLVEMKLLKKQPHGNLGTYFLMGTVDLMSKTERPFIIDLAEKASTAEGKAHLATEFERIFAPRKYGPNQKGGKERALDNALARSRYLLEIDRLALPSEFKHTHVLEAVEECVLEIGEQCLSMLLQKAGSLYSGYIDTEEAIQLHRGHSGTKVQLAVDIVVTVHRELRQISAAPYAPNDMQTISQMLESEAFCPSAWLKNSNIHILGGGYLTETDKINLVNGR